MAAIRALRLDSASIVVSAMTWASRSTDLCKQACKQQGVRVKPFTDLCKKACKQQGVRVKHLPVYNIFQIVFEICLLTFCESIDLGLTEHRPAQAEV